MDRLRCKFTFIMPIFFFGHVEISSASTGRHLIPPEVLLEMVATGAGLRGVTLFGPKIGSRLRPK